ncbi:hypothetical protein NQ318_014416 [Aromia moschata]|uniref:Uncharacterized protein n=1 Tax=Aromia moschata TaxID=1265417 RepID=A0AAV8Y5I3_9CUCU|nr:hypothetical protein NQ318_014416 [Aromia moschata]
MDKLYIAVPEPAPGESQLSLPGPVSGVRIHEQEIHAYIIYTALKKYDTRRITGSTTSRPSNKRYGARRTESRTWNSVLHPLCERVVATVEHDGATYLVTDRDG